MTEEQLRQSLRNLTDSIEPSVDLVAVARNGTHLRRARLARWSLAAIPVLAVAALAIWPPTGGAPISATPAPAPTVTAALTAPSAPTQAPTSSPACSPIDSELLRGLNEATNVGGYVRFVEGQMIHAAGDWWLIAGKAQIDNPEYKNVNGINDDGLLAFASNAPAGGRNWVRLSDEAEWDGTTSTGETITNWRELRTAVLGCARPAAR